MIELITGKKGSGKTKMLIEMINKSVASNDGNIVCIEKGAKLTYDLSHHVRLIDVDHFFVSGYDNFYGFLCGIISGNYDINEIYVDSLLKIGSNNYDDLSVFLDKISKIVNEFDIKLVLAISEDINELPEDVKKYA